MVTDDRIALGHPLCCMLAIQEITFRTPPCIKSFGTILFLVQTHARRLFSGAQNRHFLSSSSHCGYHVPCTMPPIHSNPRPINRDTPSRDDESVFKARTSSWKLTSSFCQKVLVRLPSQLACLLAGSHASYWCLAI